ncbi:PHB depolymerase family esterase [Rheinheimera sp.]|uniref:extracellular catalytic domain type 2 short-chain-length polyhydroxyalkanoate depolymerase n=1 Tax=Rheinheimera sp. TaxID=1869214 RepID=UPI00307CDECB
MKTLAFALLLGSVQAAPLPKLQLDLSQTTVSGLSSGGYMAAQFHLAHADWVKGAAIVAAGPVYCAQNNLLTALDHCIHKVDSAIPLDAINQQLNDWMTQGKLAGKTQLAQSRVWLLHGNKDQKIHPDVAAGLYQQYQQWLPAAQLSYVSDKPFAHHMPTLNAGSDCATSEAPYLGNCNYDAAAQALAFILPGFQAATTEATGQVYPLAQHQIAGDAAATMAEQGYVYIPKACAEGESCRLHISFHGCNQAVEAVQMAYVERAGFNRHADSNKLVVLYPQARASKLMPLNPQGCWDWWGYTNADYANRQGPQIQAVVKLAQALKG